MFIPQRISTLIEKRQKENKTLTIVRMANEIGISSDSLNKTKAGKSMPGADMLEKIALYFGVGVNYFFDTFDNIPEYKPNEQKPLMLRENNEKYDKTESSVDRLLSKVFDQQEEIVELRVELERVKNSSAHEKAAQAG